MVVDEHSSLTNETEIGYEFTGISGCNSFIKLFDVYACKVIYLQTCLRYTTAGGTILDYGSPLCFRPSQVSRLCARSPWFHRLLFWGFFAMSLLNFYLYHKASWNVFVIGTWVGLGMISLELVLELLLFLFVDIWVLLFWKLFFFFKVESCGATQNDFIRFYRTDTTSLIHTDFKTHALAAFFQEKRELKVMIYDNIFEKFTFWGHTLLPTISAFVCGLYMVNVGLRDEGDPESLGTSNDIVTRFYGIFVTLMVGGLVIECVVALLDALLCCGAISEVVHKRWLSGVVKRIKKELEEEDRREGVVNA